MYQLFSTKQYEKSLSRLRQGKSWNEAAVRRLLGFLRSDIALPSAYQDHQLKGDMETYRECHIKHNLLLIYERNEANRSIKLLDIGTHDDLFGA